LVVEVFLVASTETSFSYLYRRNHLRGAFRAFPGAATEPRISVTRLSTCVTLTTPPPRWKRLRQAVTNTQPWLATSAETSQIRFVKWQLC